jgi:predicted DNA-binding helix-hairpin-helix protein
MGKNQETQMEKMLEVTRNLRFKENFCGYIHLKILPGISKDKIDEATSLASRVSINIEAPNKSRISELTTTKDFKIDVLRRMRWIKKKARKNNLPSGHSTQLVVGPAGETDREILSRTEKLYKEMELKRAYFSAFVPVTGTPFENKKREPLKRENFLYRADFLMRLYGIKRKELVFNDEGNFDLSVEPKTAMALHSDLFPLDVNEASFAELIRVPGVGPITAKRIKAMQETGFRFSKESELKNLGVVLKRALPFIELNGRKQSSLLEFC